MGFDTHILAATRLLNAQPAPSPTHPRLGRAGYAGIGHAVLPMAEEEGVEPTEDAARPPPDLKSGHPTGDVSLPFSWIGWRIGQVNRCHPSCCRITTHVCVMF